MSTNQLPSSPDTRSRAERRRPAPKTYRAIEYRYGNVTYVRCSKVNGGEPLPYMRPRPSNYRSRYEPHFGAKQFLKRAGLWPVEPLTPAQVEPHSNRPALT